MNNNLTQPEEIKLFIKEFSDSFNKSEFNETKTLKTKASREKVSDDEYYIPLYKTRTFN